MGRFVKLTHAGDPPSCLVTVGIMYARSRFRRYGPSPSCSTSPPLTSERGESTDGPDFGPRSLSRTRAPVSQQSFCACLVRQCCPMSLPAITTLKVEVPPERRCWRCRPSSFWTVDVQQSFLDSPSRGETRPSTPSVRVCSKSGRACEMIAVLKRRLHAQGCR
jgi:hypothetical protein